MFLYGEQEFKGVKYDNVSFQAKYLKVSAKNFPRVDLFLQPKLIFLCRTLLSIREIGSKGVWKKKCQKRKNHRHPVKENHQTIRTIMKIVYPS